MPRVVAGIPVRWGSEVEVSEHEHGVDLDAAVSRLEDLLLALPFDRALPDLPVLLARSGLPPEALRRDERVLKVLHEAVIARPFADRDHVAATRVEVELLTLEVEVLTDRLAAPPDEEGDVVAALDRLRTVRARLEEIQREL